MERNYSRLNHILLEQSDPAFPTWLPIEPHRELDGVHPTMYVEDLRKMLRSLAQTCRSLRAFVLPLLWEVVHIVSLNQLGRLREVLRVSPDLAHHVRSFVFVWNMGILDGECAHHYEHYPADHGSLLDMAFRNRSRMWETFARKHRCEILQHDSESEEESDSDGENYASIFKGKRHYFRHNGQTFEQPGEHPFAMPGHRTLTDMLKPTDGRKFLVSGPDGKGEDRRIKSPVQFYECLNEVVAQLTSIETFGWCSHIAPMSSEVYNVLKRLPNLQNLHVRFSAHRGALCTCELLPYRGSLVILISLPPQCPFGTSPASSSLSRSGDSIPSRRMVLPSQTRKWTRRSSLHARFLPSKRPSASRKSSLCTSS